MNRPWMPLYVADYLSDTAHLSAAESGAYLHLIMHYWQKGSLPDDDRLLARIARMSPEQWAEARGLIADFFDEGWTHSRIEAEIAKAQEISDKRADAARQRKRKPDADDEQLLDTCTALDDTRARVPQSQSQSSLRSDVSKPAEPKAKVKKQAADDLIAVVLVDGGLSERTARDVIAHRKAKGARLTERAAELLIRKFAACEHGAEFAAETMIAQGWRGFEPAWMARISTRAPPMSQPPKRNPFFKAVEEKNFQGHVDEPDYEIPASILDLARPGSSSDDGRDRPDGQRHGRHREWPDDPFAPRADR